MRAKDVGGEWCGSGLRLGLSAKAAAATRGLSQSRTDLSLLALIGVWCGSLVVRTGTWLLPSGIRQC